MIKLEDAFRTVMDSVRTTGSEVISFTDSLGRVLAEDILSDTDLPPFDRSAVDGYACRMSDMGLEMEVIEIIRAGRMPLKEPAKGECSKIMTGAIVPAGCDVVIMVEETKTLSSGKVVFTGSSPKPNIARRGEDVRAGDRVMKKGLLIKPQDIAVMASVGHVNVKVAVKPGVGIISTGDELVEPGQKPGMSFIRNSNSYQLLAQSERTGATGRYYGIAPDNEEITYNLIAKAISENDIVLLTGGVSMGDFDFVPSVLEKAGVKIKFDKVNVQPGKPTTFGIHPDALVFGLPGNPVSAFVQFEMLVRPLIYKMSGFDWSPREIDLAMAEKYQRKAVSRFGLIPVMISRNNEVIPVEYHGSAHITAFPYADGLIPIEPGKAVIKKGEIVKVRLI